MVISHSSLVEREVFLVLGKRGDLDGELEGKVNPDEAVGPESDVEVRLGGWREVPDWALGHEV